MEVSAQVSLIGSARRMHAQTGAGQNTIGILSARILDASASFFNLYSLWTYTMNRWIHPSFSKRRWAPLALGLLAALLAWTAWAESGFRQFPKQALRGSLVVTSTPQVMLDGKPDRLSPGSRIRNTQNMVVMPSSVNGQTLVVNYVREINGLIHEVWILTEKEALEKRAGGGTQTNIVFASQLPASAPLGQSRSNQIQIPQPAASR